MSGRTLTVRPRPAPAEHRHTFPCFGGECTVLVADALRPADAAAAAAMARRALLSWHQRFSRFEPTSELSRMNADPAETVRVSPLMRRALHAALRAARDTGGLVDVTVGGRMAAIGYGEHLDPHRITPADSGHRAPPRAPASPDAAGRWRQIAIDDRRGTVTRPADVQIDLGGIVKGVFADELAELLGGFDAFALDCAGDVRVGGRASQVRPVDIAAPAPGAPRLDVFALTAGAVATSGISRRRWIGPDNRPGHHLVDPGTGAPAYTGIVQATALAPTAAEAEGLAKAALLSGPERAAAWLTHGGGFVTDGGRYERMDPPGRTAETSVRPASQRSMSSSTASRSGSFRISWNRPS